MSALIQFCVTRSSRIYIICKIPLIICIIISNPAQDIHRPKPKFPEAQTHIHSSKLKYHFFTLFLCLMHILPVPFNSVLDTLQTVHFASKSQSQHLKHFAYFVHENTPASNACNSQANSTNKTADYHYPLPQAIFRSACACATNPLPAPGFARKLIESTMPGDSGETRIKNGVRVARGSLLVCVHA